MKTVIGIVGPIGSGKDTAAKYIADKLHISHLEISAPLKDLAKEKGLEPTRENLIRIGTENAKEMGETFLARLLLNRIETAGVITGMRLPAQIHYFRDTSHLILISIDANPHIRFERAKARGKVGEANTYELFVTNEQKENMGEGPQRVFACMKLADYQVLNNTNITELLYGELDEILKKENLLAPEEEAGEPETT